MRNSTIGMLLCAAALPGVAQLNNVKTVFVILMENHNWSQIKGSASAPYINNTLIPMAARAEQYYNPPGIHPSLPNYLWLEAGTNFGIANDSDPSVNHQSTTSHLATQLTTAGISWKTYQENITGDVPPDIVVSVRAEAQSICVFRRCDEYQRSEFGDVHLSRAAVQRVRDRPDEQYGGALRVHHAEPVQRHARFLRAGEQFD